MVSNSEGSSALPLHLYKYRNLLGDGRKHIEQLLRSADLYFAAPNSFNDPLDSQVHLDFPNSPTAFRKWLVGAMKAHRPDLNRRQREELAAEEVRRKKPHRNTILQEAIIADLQRDVDRLGVFCLCDHADDILMWSHYGAGHSGVCLEFETDFGEEGAPSARSLPGSDNAPGPVRVAYSSTFPSVGFFESNERQVQAILLTKAERWSYEREWRIIDFKGPGLRHFDPWRLSGIIFGCRMIETDRKAIKEWIEAGPTRPRLYEASIAAGSYSLDVRPLEEAAPSSRRI
ncbi:MAG TPA: DUF2971 domain-containing protein [Thermoanaerobaculia bacterium]|jgi:hypothetical protein|nr:DUF2971 domain-containing protein [Thermoanaerobaculia bacterium]